MNNKLRELIRELIVEIPEVLSESETKERAGRSWHLDRVWQYINETETWVCGHEVAPHVFQNADTGRWIYSIPSHAKTGASRTKEEAMTLVENVLREG